MSGRYFSQNAWIDIATNYASFDAIDFSEDFPDFLSGKFRSAHLLTLLHEATHHWSLTTPVGTALAARTFRTYSNAAHAAFALQAGETLESRHADELAVSVMTSQMLTAFFVPLLEGLALYAEWRAGPSVNGIYSRPFDIFAKFSGINEVPDEDMHLHRDLVEAMAGKSGEERSDVLMAWARSEPGRQADRKMTYRMTEQLRSLRTRPAERKRLKQVFTSSMDPRLSSYQLGYVFVCALERLCWGAENTDRFMAYLRDYFFHDYALASAILDDQLDPDSLYSLVRQSLQTKVNNLIRNNPADFDAMRAWGDAIRPASFENVTIDDFFGRPAAEAGGGSDGDGDPAYEAYVGNLDAFCEAAGSVLVPPVMLRNFLAAGRVLMPLGSKEFEVAAVTADRLELLAVDGVKMSLFAGDFSERPSTGDQVVVTMMVNVVSPGTSVAVRWDENFEAVSLVEDAISKPLIEAVHHSAERIRQVVSAGQKLIKHLRLQNDEGVEAIEQATNSFLSSDAVTLDIVQIYRAAIVMAFATDHPNVVTSQWRQDAYSAFEPHGLATVFEDRANLDLFLQVCGMPKGHYVSVDRLRSWGIEGADAELDRMVRDFYAAINGILEADHDKVVEQLNEVAEKSKLTLFDKLSHGGWGSLL